MQKENCFLVGTVFKLHGYKGQVKIYNNKEIHLDFNSINYFLIDHDNILVPFFCIKSRQIKNNIILVNFEDIDSEKKALSILKKDVYLPIKFLTKTQKESLNEIQFIGFQVVDVHQGKLGEISYVNSKNPQELIYVKKDGKEFCFPMHEEFINHIDNERKILNVNIPEDLINLN
tara:strand:- start:1334 stop:1855 length:522 start_codon:yes stop_codon:yes gene_type:complete